MVTVQNWLKILYYQLQIGKHSNEHKIILIKNETTIGKGNKAK